MSQSLQQIHKLELKVSQSRKMLNQKSSNNVNCSPSSQNKLKKSKSSVKHFFSNDAQQMIEEEPEGNNDAVN